jgi:hypothetical protein
MAHFVSMHVGMDWMTTVKTQTVVDPLNKVV